MRPWIMTLVLLLAVLAVGIAILGCSGAGTSAAQVSGAPVQALAADNLSAVVQVGSWLQILYPPPAPPGGACKSSSHSVTLPNGSIHHWGVSSNCTTWDELWNPKGSGTWTLTPPTGPQIKSTWHGDKEVGGIETYYMTEEIRGVGTLNHYDTWNWNEAGTPRTLSGTATLASDGGDLRFSWSRVDQGADVLALTLPDGMVLRFRVPLTTDTRGNPAPVMTTGLHGSVTPASGASLEFTVTGDKGAWTKWQIRSADGTTQGTFALGGGLSGNGELTSGGKIVGALSWLAGGQGTLDQLSIGSRAVTPSAAAQAFEIDRWVSNSAELGPSPEY